MEPFQFKQFSVSHYQSGIPIGTDAVLLGAWAEHSAPKNILDIGTGCGVIALMLAQRYPKAMIEGVDINNQAIIEAQQNATNSPWKDRLNFFQGNAIKGFNKKYDLICANPPYFENSTPSPVEQRSKARHQQTLPLDKLIEVASEHLAKNGKLCLILPHSTELPTELQLTRQTDIRPTPAKNPKRKLVVLQHHMDALVTHDAITIELSRHHYTEAYINLTKEFYLHM